MPPSFTMQPTFKIQSSTWYAYTLAHVCTQHMCTNVCLHLGIGEAGKSTFIKQMKVIHGGGYSDEERLKYKQQIYQNVYIAIHNLTHAMTKLRVSYKSEETKVFTFAAFCCHRNCHLAVVSIRNHHSTLSL